MILPDEGDGSSKNNPPELGTNRQHSEIHPPPPAYSSRASLASTRTPIRPPLALSFRPEPPDDRSQRSFQALKKLRVFVFICSTFLAAIALIVAGRSTILTAQATGGYLPSVAMCICIALLTCGTLPTMIHLDRSTEVPFSSMIIVETVWIGLLSLLWMTTGALNTVSTMIMDMDTENAGGTQNNAGGKDQKSHPPGLGPGACFFVGGGLCHSLAAIQGFAYTIWLLLMSYAIILCVLGVIAKKRGHRYVWTSAVREGTLFAPRYNPKLFSFEDNVDIPLVESYPRSTLSRSIPYQTTNHASSSSSLSPSIA